MSVTLPVLRKAIENLITGGHKTKQTQAAHSQTDPILATEQKEPSKKEKKKRERSPEKEKNKRARSPSVDSFIKDEISESEREERHKKKKDKKKKRKAVVFSEEEESS
jgi:hypothetical protein